MQEPGIVFHSLGECTVPEDCFIVWIYRFSSHCDSRNQGCGLANILNEPGNLPERDFIGNLYVK